MSHCGSILWLSPGRILKNLTNNDDIKSCQERRYRYAGMVPCLSGGEEIEGKTTVLYGND